MTTIPANYLITEADGDAPMRGLSLTEPWATLVAIGAKKIETRSWGTDYRGPIVIHASVGMATAAADEIRLPGPIQDALRRQGIDPYTGLDLAADAAFSWDNPKAVRALVGAPTTTLMVQTRRRVLAFARLESCERITTHTALPAEPEASFGYYLTGRYMWGIADVVRLPIPYPAIGHLGLWPHHPDPDAALFVAGQKSWQR